jgi:hypothetical protein
MKSFLPRQGLPLLLVLAMTSSVIAGTSTPWKELPQTVRATILSNGGKKGQPADLEKRRPNGLSLYEAGVRSKDGSTSDLMITADGKLIQTKHDDAEDKAAEVFAAKGQGVMVFSHPRKITNPYLPLANLKEDILVGGKEASERVVRTARPDLLKTFTINGKKVQALTVVDQESIGGKVIEITRDYFAQDDAGNVYYLGEDVDSYKNGKITGHDGAWLLGKDTAMPGLLLPAKPKMHSSFSSENVPQITTERDKIISLSAKVTVPAGTFRNCVKVEEHASDGSTEFKYFAPGIGCVMEQESDGSTKLQSHSTHN